MIITYVISKGTFLKTCLCIYLYDILSFICQSSHAMQRKNANNQQGPGLRFQRFGACKICSCFFHKTFMTALGSGSQVEDPCSFRAMGFQVTEKPHSCGGFFWRLSAFQLMDFFEGEMRSVFFHFGVVTVCSCDELGPAKTEARASESRCFLGIIPPNPS